MNLSWSSEADWRHFVDSRQQHSAEWAGWLRFVADWIHSESELLVLAPRATQEKAAAPGAAVADWELL